jgi:hypothetical protein
MDLIKSPPHNKIVPSKSKHNFAFMGGLNFKLAFLDLCVFLLDIFVKYDFDLYKLGLFMEKMVQIHQISKKNSKSLDFYDKL